MFLSQFRRLEHFGKVMGHYPNLGKGMPDFDNS